MLSLLTAVVVVAAAALHISVVAAHTSPVDKVGADGS
jgi:hypothetical protein